MSREMNVAELELRFKYAIDPTGKLHVFHIYNNRIEDCIYASTHVDREHPMPEVLSAVRTHCNSMELQGICPNIKVFDSQMREQTSLRLDELTERLIRDLLAEHKQC